MQKPRALVLDIETSPLETIIWKLKDQYVGLNQIIKDWEIVAWSVKEFGASVNSIKYYDKRKDKTDKPILYPLWEALNKTDYIITQNGKAFDWPKIKARMMLNGMEPPSHFQHIDVYKELKDVGFTSHSLEYLTSKFCKKYKKTSHSRFPGFSLWLECAKDNIKAWNEMKAYNILDVLSTEELLNNTLQWLPKVQYKLSHPIIACHKCGGKSFTSNGIRPTKNAYIRRYCKACGELTKEPLDKSTKA